MLLPLLTLNSTSRLGGVNSGAWRIELISISRRIRKRLEKTYDTRIPM